MAAPDSSFAQALDAVRDGLAFFDGAGRQVHANRRWNSLAPAVRTSSTIDEIADFIRELASIIEHRRLAAPVVVDDILQRRVETAHGRVCMRGSFVGVDLFNCGPLLLLNLEAERLDPTDQELKRQYGLTRQEIRTVRLITEGSSNAEIADALSISQHTARHHTENVMRKLGVRSRRDVRRRISPGEK